MRVSVTIGQKWSTWVPGRGQWLLSTVVRRDKGYVILQYDPRYGIAQDEHKADEDSMSGNTNLFRLVVT